MCTVSLVIASGSCCGELPLDKTAVPPPKIPEHNHLTDTDNTIRNDLNDVDNGNKPGLPYDQDDQTWFCFVKIVRIVRRVRLHKDAALDLARYHYP
jgi:hypothetical protein